MNRRRMVIAGVVTVAVVATAATTYAVSTGTNASADHYRTTTPTRGDLTATVSLSGTLTHVNEVTATFPTSGVVTWVAVHAGQKVNAGDVLATMDGAPLQAALLEAKSQVAAAELAIEQDQAAASTATPSAPAASSSTTSQSTSGAAAAAGKTTGATSGSHSTTTVGGTASSGAKASQAEIAKAMAAVSQAQNAVDGQCKDVLGGLGSGRVTTSPVLGPPTAKTVADHADTVTGLPGPGSSPRPSVTASPSPSATPSPSPTPSVGPVSPSPSPSPAPTASGQNPDAGALSRCLTALQGLSTAEHEAATVLSTAAQTAASTAGAGAAGAGAAGSTAGGGLAAAGAPTTSSSAAAAAAAASAAKASAAASAAKASATKSGTATGGQAGGGAMSPEAKLLADQGTLATAQQQQTQAQNNLDAATLTAPISGVVGAVDISSGNRATASHGIVIVGPGAAQVNATAALADLEQVAVGDHVQVRTVGSSTTLDGTLSAVGALPSSGSGTDAPSYPVVITVPTGADGLPEGAPATTSIVTTSLAGALVIPSSALATTSTGATQVTTLSEGTTRTVDVSVGARGQGRVQVLSGIGSNDVVVLADVNAPLPSLNLANTRQAFRGTGGGAAAGPTGGGAAPSPSSTAGPRG
ncbi:biotin/lipoyl-binding protein [Raineyella fluvialis]|uniref:Biotin/lipoyl-binding protein n=1 Tax=Raineyella fluvialis TaxID=2662261 RepID=A0A5Q2FGF1_9ACTN|nr:biotin/lipoyl-binding protein [Raineyella fluvialis]QGF24604.1 biotin/lipoyl-binding protein [Raineyella fluvialis]